MSLVFEPDEGSIEIATIPLSGLSAVIVPIYSGRGLSLCHAFAKSQEVALRRVSSGNDGLVANTPRRRILVSLLSTLANGR